MGLPSPRASSPPVIPAPVTTQPAETATPTPASILSPLARPFYPSTGGRPKALRWLDVAEDEDARDDDLSASDAWPALPLRRPVTYRDAVVCPAAPSPTATPPARSPPPPHAPAHPQLVRVPPARSRPTRRSRRRRPPAELVIGLPVRRSPPPRRRPPQKLGISDQLRARLGPRVAAAAVARPCSRGSSRASLPRGAPRPARAVAMASRVDADGFQEVVSRATLRQLRQNSSPPAPMEDLRPRKRILPELEGKCLNCLSYKHRVATCKLPQRCLRCHGFRHLAKDCKRPRNPPGGDLPPRRLVNYCRTITPTSQTGSQTPSTMPPATQAGRTRHRRPRQCSGLVKPVPTTSVGVQQGSSCCACQAAVFETSCFRDEWSPLDYELDPMCLEAAIAGLPQSRGRESGPLHQAKDPKAGAEAEPVDLSTTVPPHRSWASEDSESTPRATDVLELPRLELGSPEDGPEFPPGFELGCEASGSLDIGLHNVAGSTPFEEPASTEATATVVASDVDHSVALEAFINKVTKDIPAPLLDKPLRRRRVDPVLVDAPPQLPSSEAFGIRRSYRQALDPLSAIKTAKRGEVLLMRRLGEVGVSLPLAASVDQAVKQFFQEGPPPHHWDALSDMFPMLKNKSKLSPFVGLSGN